MLDGEVIATILFQFGNAFDDFIKLLFENHSLPFNRHWYFFKLRMTDNNGIVIAGSDTTAELFSVLRFKVLFGRYKDIGGGIELQIFCRPLFCQMVRNDKE